MVRTKELRLEKVTIRNIGSVDKRVKDAFGEEHVIFPGKEKRILVLRKEK